MWIASSITDHLKNVDYIKDIYLTVSPYGQGPQAFRIKKIFFREFDLNYLFTREDSQNNTETI